MPAPTVQPHALLRLLGSPSGRHFRASLKISKSAESRAAAEFSCLTIFPEVFICLSQSHALMQVKVQVGVPDGQMNTTGKLTALVVKRAHRRGTYGDGHGLYLQVAKGGSKSWVLRFKRGGRTRTFGLGPFHTISLAQARERAADARRLLLDGQDPVEVKRASADCGTARGGGYNFLRPVCCNLYRGAPPGMAQCPARQAMDGNDRDTRQSDHRHLAGAGDRHRINPESAGTRMEGHARDGDAAAGAN